MIVELLVVVPHKCKFQVAKNNEPSAEHDCDEPAAFLLCYHAGHDHEPTALWACEYHKNEAERQEEAFDANPD